MLYDVKEKQKRIKRYLRKLRAQVNRDEVDGLCIIAIRKDRDIERYQLDGEVSIIEWVGALESVKVYFLTHLLKDE